MSDEAIILGKAVTTAASLPESQGHVLLQARLGNRHGLVAGATGTGKTVTLMTIAEGFSRMGVPVFLADVKGDVAGLAVPGAAGDKLAARVAQITSAPVSSDVSPKQVVAPSGSILSMRLPTVGLEASPDVVSDSPHLHETHSSLI